MIASELVSVRIEPVHSNFTVAEVIDLMYRFKLSHWPVVNDKEFGGLVSETDLVKSGMKDSSIFTSGIALTHVFVFEDQHIFEIIDIAARLNISLIPVLNRDKLYTGSIRIADLIPGIAILTSSGQPGAILVLSMTMHDYTLSGISRIIEENNAKIISLYTAVESGSGDLLVTLKLNTGEIAAILRSFERFGITVKSHYQGDEEIDEMYRSRFEELMRYINI